MTGGDVAQGTSNRYELLARLAEGGMAEIFLARAAGMAGFERFVVLKRIHPERGDDPQWVSMFLDEARLAAQLTHQNIAQVYDLGEIAGSYFYTMEYVHGEDVLAITSRLAALTSTMPIHVALAIAHGAAQGLHYAHDRSGLDGKPLGIVHRDVSPSNVMVTYEGVVKLLDFGVAKARTRNSETQVGTIMGKVAYLSPEQCRSRTVDRRSDIFSLGIVLYEALTQHRPFKRASDHETLHAIVKFDPPPPSQVNPALPPALDPLVMRMLAKDPSERFASAAEIVEAIEDIADAAKLTLAPRDLKRFMRELFGMRPEPWRELASASELQTFEGSVVGPIGPVTELLAFEMDAAADAVPLLSGRGGPRPSLPMRVPAGTPGAATPPPSDLASPITHSNAVTEWTAPPATQSVLVAAPAPTRRASWLIIAVSALAAIATVLIMYFLMIRDSGSESLRGAPATVTSPTVTAPASAPTATPTVTPTVTPIEATRPPEAPAAQPTRPTLPPTKSAGAAPTPPTAPQPPRTPPAAPKRTGGQTSGASQPAPAPPPRPGNKGPKCTDPLDCQY